MIFNPKISIIKFQLHLYHIQYLQWTNSKANQLKVSPLNNFSKWLKKSSKNLTLMKLNTSILLPIKKILIMKLSLCVMPVSLNKMIKSKKLKRFQKSPLKTIPMVPIKDISNLDKSITESRPLKHLTQVSIKPLKVLKIHSRM